MKISVIIPTLNRKNSLFMTLDSYKKYEEDYYEIIVIDQSSKKIEESEIEKYSKIKYIHYPKPSLTRARNIGINSANGDILIFSDDDIEIFEETLKNVKNIFKNFPKISLIGGLNYYDRNNLSKKSNIKTYLSCLIGRRNIFKLKKGHIVDSIFGVFPINIDYGQKLYIDTEWAMGYFFACRKSLIKKWEIRFDENLISYAYAEDLDFTYRYGKKSKSENLKMIFTPMVEVYHHCSQEYRIPDYKKTLLYIFNRRYLSYKFNKSFYSRILIEMNDVIIFLIRILKKEKILDFLQGKFLSYKYNKCLRKKIYPKEIKKILDE